MKPFTPKMVAELSQTLIAVLVVGGGLVAMLTGSTHVPEIVPFMALVVGFYFGRSIQSSGNDDTGGTTGG